MSREKSVEGFQNGEKSTKQEKKEERFIEFVLERIELLARRIFHDNKSEAGRKSFILKNLELVLKRDLIDDTTKEKLLADIDRAVKKTDEEDFVNSVISSFQPVIEEAVNNPKEIDRISRDQFEKDGFIRASDLIYYSIDGKELHLHTPISVSYSDADMLGSAKQGIKKIAEIVRGNKDIELIKAKSWIVTRAPHIFIGWGFKIDADISGKNRKKLLEEKVDLTAYASREEFLERNLQ